MWSDSEDKNIRLWSQNKAFLETEQALNFVNDPPLSVRMVVHEQQVSGQGLHMNIGHLGGY